MKKLLALLLSVVTALSCGIGLVACKEDAWANTTVIYWRGTGGCMGTEWIEGVAREYEEMHKETVFEDGKKGVHIEISQVHSLSTGDLSTTSPYDIISLEYDHVNDYVAKGLLVDLTELYNRTDSPYRKDGEGTIASRILPESRAQAAVVETNDTTGDYETHYYALPHYEFSSGLIYDRELFNDYNLYFAEDQSSTSDGYPVETKFGTAYFIGEAGGEPYDGVEVSYGPDFEQGTADDGLPKSLQELAMLCEYMKLYCSIEPLQFPGGHVDYSNILTCGLYASLAGFEALQSTSTFKGTIEVVDTVHNGTGMESQFDLSTPLFEGATGVPSAETSWMTIDQTVDNTTGWRTQELAAKYYAMAFAQIAYENEFYSSDSRNSGTQSHTASQKQFMSNSKNDNPIGMLIENTYIWNEMRVEGVFDDYRRRNNNADPAERDIRFMPLPSVLTNADKATSQRTDWSNTLIDSSACVLMVSKKQVHNQGKMDAIFDFLDYIYSNEQLIEFTKQTGMYRGLDYQLTEADKEGLSLFTQNYFAIRENGKVVRHSGDNPVFVQNGSGLSINIWGVTWRLANGKDNMITIMKDRNFVNFIDTFNAVKVGQSQWSAYLNALKDSEGNSVKWIDFGLDEAERPEDATVTIYR